MGKILGKYGLTPTGKLLALIVGIVVAALIFSLTYNLITAKVYYTCKQLKADGYVHIKRGDAKYQPGLDRDHDGIACD